jgi:hypothetical protein
MTTYEATYNGKYSIGMPGPGGEGQLEYNGAGVVVYKNDNDWTFYGKDPKVTIQSRYAGNHTLTKATGWWGGKSRRNRKSKKSKKRKSRKTARRH